ncbi:unnamed protein product [Effrenium voratum]|uniref:Uncharacterized protein n=1 Tax=Effrenium voratum TaxID=2562239 RepID=A0AA36IBG6_9DINO|nr:unnamed protein product [Effrenium voratum]CAJ1426445.1 unnamed protein product [Effrenium voratum]CAJ1426447.1 unnamed protein product [Effrenium voratum]
MGESMFSSRSESSGAASVRFSGFGSSASVKASGAWREDRSGGSAEQNEQQSSQKLNSQRKSLYRSRYYLEPRARIQISEDMLQPTSDFEKALHFIQETLCALHANHTGADECTPPPLRTPGAENDGLFQNQRIILISFLVTHLKHGTTVLQPALANSMKNAITNAVLSYTSSLEPEAVSVAIAKPSKSKGVNIYQNTWVTVVLSLGDDVDKELANLRHASTRQFLQNTLLSAILTTPHIGSAFASNKENVTLAPSFFSLKEELVPLTSRETEPEDEVNVTAVAVPAPTSPAPSAGDQEPSTRKTIEGMMDQTMKRVVDELFFHYGTHVCPQVVLGGWWKVTASFHSAHDQKVVDMSNIVSAALDETEATANQQAFSVSGSGSGVSASASGERQFAKGGASSNSSVLGRRDINRAATKRSTLEVTQEWKGGASGTAPADWRRSLDGTLNSNWRVIDRQVDRCLGVWTWARSKTLRSIMCTRWLELYLASAQLSDEEMGKNWQVVCSDAAGLHTLQEQIADIESRRPVQVWGQQCETNDCRSVAQCPDGYAVVGCRSDGLSDGLILEGNACVNHGAKTNQLIAAWANCSQLAASRGPAPKATYADSSESRCPGGAVPDFCLCHSPWKKCVQNQFPPRGNKCAFSFTPEPDQRRRRSFGFGVRVQAVCLEWSS